MRAIRDLLVLAAAAVLVLAAFGWWAAAGRGGEWQGSIEDSQ